MQNQFTDGDVFDINDFTTASDWEKFVSDLEQTLRQWGLSSGHHKSGTKRLTRDQFSCVSWSHRAEVLRFGRVPLSVQHIFADGIANEEPLDASSPRIGHELPLPLQDTSCSESDFLTKCPPVSQLFGVREFVLISSAQKNEPISDISRVKLLMSSAAIASGNISCQVPVFVNVNQAHHFVGILSDAGIRTSFQMVCLKHVPQKFGYLSELLSIFKEKMGYCTSETPAPVRVSVRFLNVLRKGPEALIYSQHRIPPEGNPLKSCRSIDLLCYDEPIREIRMSHMWENLSEELINESPFHSDLDPRHAPVWMLELKLNDKMESSLWSYFSSLMALNQKHGGLKSALLSRLENSDSETDVKNVLDRLSGHVPVAFNLPAFQTFLPRISNAFLFSLIESIFEPRDNNELAQEEGQANDGLKSCPYDNLTWRVSHAVASVCANYRDFDSVVLLWKEIVNRLRFYWENNEPLPGLQGETVDASTCLLNQKMQMLNCCIGQKIKWSCKEDAEDKFYDALEDLQPELKAEGRLHRLQNMCLLDSSEGLFVPVCQDATPMTDDMLQEQSEILSQMGSSAEATALRLKMQLPSLVSDMEAFKAANPGARLEDFVRWYSPRDYDDEKGLSDRMQIEGNAWSQAWNSAKSVPAARQKKLFDHTKEAEKVLHYLSSFTFSSLVTHISPVILRSAISCLHREWTALGLDAIKPFDSKSLTNAGFDAIRRKEHAILSYKSLTKKLEEAHEFHKPGTRFKVEELKGFAWELSSGSVVPVTCGDEAKRNLIEALVRLRKQREMDELDVGDRMAGEGRTQSNPLLPPLVKEYVLRIDVPRPAIYSRSLPQRMSCSLADNDFRIALTLSQDTLFS